MERWSSPQTLLLGPSRHCGGARINFLNQNELGYSFSGSLAKKNDLVQAFHCLTYEVLLSAYKMTPAPAALHEAPVKQRLRQCPINSTF